MEVGARRNGSRGRFRWLLALPWLSNPAVTGQLLGMVLFATGGITGIINGSYGMDLVVHNTLWIPGHLHTQVAGAVTLTWMAVSFWLIPFLTGRSLWSVKLSTVQVWTWFFGMAIMARGMHWMGMAGVPRRVHLTYAPYAVFDEWQTAGWLVGTGGLILVLSGALFFYIIGMTIWASRTPATFEVPEAKPLPSVPSMPFDPRSHHPLGRGHDRPHRHRVDPVAL